MSQKKVQLLNPLSGNINVAGVITASSFVGSGEGLTGVASTDNIQTATEATFLSGVKITGVTTASGGVVGNLTGTASNATLAVNAQGLTGTPNITVGSVAAASGTFSGNVTIGGTLTYQDVEHIDSVGIITAQQGIQVLANGLTITGVSTFNDNIDLQDDDKILLGSSDDLEIYHGSGVSRIDNNVGDIRIRNFADDAKIKIQTDNGSGSHTDYIICDGSNGETQLYYYGSEKLNTSNTGVTVTGTVAATSYTGDGSALSGIEVGITTTEKTASANSTVFLGLSTAQHHTINVVAGITTIDCTGGSVGESHSVVIINPSSVGTGVTVGFATDFLFPSGSVPSLPTGANDISLISFVVKQTGAGGTEVLASAGLNYSN